MGITTVDLFNSGTYNINILITIIINKNMSIIICKNCDDYIDTDFNAEHEEECIENSLLDQIELDEMQVTKNEKEAELLAEQIIDYGEKVNN